MLRNIFILMLLNCSLIGQPRTTAPPGRHQPENSIRTLWVSNVKFRIFTRSNGIKMNRAILGVLGDHCSSTLTLTVWTWAFSEFLILKVSFILSFRNPSVFNAFSMFQDLTHCSVITVGSIPNRGSTATNQLCFNRLGAESLFLAKLLVKRYFNVIQ